MSDLPVPKRRRVAPTLSDPMAPSAPGPTPPAPAISRRDAQPPAPAERAEMPQEAPVRIAVSSRRQEPTVQLATRVRVESDHRLRELAARRGTTLRQVIEDLIDNAWREQVSK
ncbi:hypothetical protein AB6N23_01840 [Cellulomonas sp. 179-A 9B4 NHS]|uniref:hypothetical protein n=1 Tax=Cellulomonas sp. 179-A 9B4 NHS TaxID=3142379 RepID=UPI00399F4F89